MSEEIKQNNNLEEEKISPAGRLERYLRLVLIFAAIILVGAAISFAAPYFFPQKQSAQTNQPKPDEIVIIKLPNGDQLVENKTQEYSATIPDNWYVEKDNFGTVVYSNYNPEDKNLLPSCKIETSILPNNNGFNLSQWINEYLHQDPTISVQSISTQPINVAGHQAIKWTGKIDGISTILVYINSGSKIYEIAPSSTDNKDVITECGNAIDSYLSNFNL